ncbi:hypothetical protein P152DRAFT_462256 [Eremomyces bilateralis CBS 781.70]|uniref:Fanconi-associated nuclease n=1 Tax=Eremomyces bilateralis CBS 781.70 TaxID=1392243 RepID=A0A6G1FSM9_9PEZI|nr:uncharacterized protein P152DRAFT_462256 [Eremomyces bilateralis CBS 781.70]KAF1808691.1 hypothetical protein P152DRAFT_462256 [Eremomyces bilateralis CBS 781.70]
MPLEEHSLSSHNRMLGHSNEVGGTANGESEPPTKKRRTLDAYIEIEKPGNGVCQLVHPEVEERQDETTSDIETEGKHPDDERQPTDLESALPPIETDEQAIDEYESYRSSQEGRKALEGRLKERKWIIGQSSIYVDAFNLALETVLEEESHLFNEAERAIFYIWRSLSYEAQYLYVRLFLRKTSAWHRVSSLGYFSDISDLESALETLQTVRDLPTVENEEQSHPNGLELPEGMTLGCSFTFAGRSEQEIKTLEEASSLLKLDELKVFAKEAKVQGKNKTELLQALRKTSRKQAGLGWVKRSNTEETTESRSGSNTPKVENDMNLDAHFLDKILKETGPCIRLSLPVLKLFERVHLVFYRSTEWTEKSLTAIILSRISRRNFPDYIVSRSASIFDSRALLIEYESALRAQFRVDNLLEFNGRPTEEALQDIIDAFEAVYPRWKTLLAEEQRKEDSIFHSGEGAYLRRLSPAWVYTRIIHKAVHVLGKQKQHLREHAVLSDLLQQRLFHASRRGAWYQRKALLEEHYMRNLMPDEGRNEAAQKKHWTRVALRTCEEGLQDPLVHIVHHYDLQKRITKLERQLKIAKRAQHDFAHVRLAKPTENTISGIRVEKSTSRPNNEGKRGSATVWLDPLEDDGLCRVESLCLSHYRSEGWKGFHTEGGILRTLFAYLFYDVLFAYVPHVFQTSFQTCPLDLHTDAFYAARMSEINGRLAQIANGGTERLIRNVYDEHHEKRTCVVGLDWNFDIDDVLEIAVCFDGEALATICKVMAQEYAQRGSGVPDLFLWRMGRKEVMFVEVKSENDRLSDNQRLWIHVMTGAGVKVELCNVISKEVRYLD